MAGARNLNEQPGDWTKKLEQLKQVHAASQQRIAGIEEQRKLFVVSALTGDAEAGKNLSRFNGEMEIASREESDALDAIEQVSQKISSIQACIATSARREERDGICDLIRARIEAKREERVADLIRQLKGELAELHASNREILSAVREFNPGIVGFAQIIQERQRQLLDPDLRPQPHLRMIVEIAPGQFARLLEALETTDGLLNEHSGEPAGMATRI